MAREIDLQALLQTSQRRPRVRAGEVIIREGDASVALFVVLSGKVDLAKAGPNGAAVNVGSVAPGEVFGYEVLANLPAGVTAVAAEDVTLLVLDPRTALELMVRRPRFALGLLQMLCDRGAVLERVAASGTVVAAPSVPPTPPVGQRIMPPPSVRTPRSTPAIGARATPPATPARATDARTPGNSTAPAVAEEKPAAMAAPAPPAELPKEFWSKQVTCPVCAAEFPAVHLRAEAVRLQQRDSDFCEHYQGHNPLHYAIYVCPDCRYAAYPDDFPGLAGHDAVAVGTALAGLPTDGSVDADFRGLRDAAAARASFRLALICYQTRNAEPRRLAGLHHRLAWLARQAGETDAEQTHLADARDAYKAALDQRPPLEGRAEAMVFYLLADISARVGESNDAMRWLEAAAKHPEIDKGLTRNVQDLRQTIRERARG